MIVDYDEYSGEQYWRVIIPRAAPVTGWVGTQCTAMRRSSPYLVLRWHVFGEGFTGA